MSALPLVQTQKNLSLICKPLAGQSIEGTNLRYDPVYDEIRKARFEDDHHLSRGVWQHDLKKAEHDKVNNLCLDVLCFKSKDLQILMWLIESWVHLYKMPGFVEGTFFLETFCNTFQEKYFPTDIEQRISLFEWFDERFSKILMTLPITESPIELNLPNYSLHDGELAKKLDAAIQRSGEYANKTREKAEAKGEVTAAKFHMSVFKTPINVFKDLKNDCEKVEKNILSFKKYLQEIDEKNAPSFSKIFTSLQLMKKLSFDAIKSSPQAETDLVINDNKNENDEEGANASVLSKVYPTAEAIQTSRIEAYEQLRQLADIFHSLEPHGPTSSFLKKIATWENKTLMEIIGPFTQSGDAMGLLMYLLSDETQRK